MDSQKSWTSTTYKPLITGSRYSLLEMELITGKTHQIRSHLASIGHPILGDPKYGNPKINEKIRAEYGVRGQMLWCCRVEFPKMEGDLAALSGRVIVCDPPALYREIAGRNRI
jgi:23S rRNA pseudouridine955/2504/2580 synthase